MPKRGNKSKGSTRPSQSSRNQMRQLLENTANSARHSGPSTPDVRISRFIPRPANVIQSASSTIISSTTVDVAGSIINALTSSADASSWAAVYDRYRIMSVVAKWVPFSSSQPGFVHTVVDYDDANVPTSESYMLQYDTLETAPAGVNFERTWIPRVAVAVYNGALTAYGQPKPFFWIDAAGPSVQHYGLKYYIPATSAVSSWKVILTVHFQFQDSH